MRLGIIIEQQLSNIFLEFKLSCFVFEIFFQLDIQYYFSKNKHTFE